MTLGKSFNTSAKLSAWDQDPSYTVRLQKQRKNVCEHLLRRARCVYLGNQIWMGFSVWERLQQWDVVLVCLSDMKLYHCLASYSKKKHFNQKSSYLSSNNLLLGRQSSFQSVPGSSHTCPVLLLSTKKSTSQSQQVHTTVST